MKIGLIVYKKLYLIKWRKTWVASLTVFPKLVFFFPPLCKTLDSFLKGLEQNGFRNLQRRIVSLPELEVDLREDVARDRRISWKE